MVIVVVVILLFLVLSIAFFVSKSLNDFINAEETIKKETWEEEKMLDTDSPRIPRSTSQSKRNHE